MKNTSIYLTGFPGFKSAVIASLGPEWLNDTQDVSQELMHFNLPKKTSVENFKQLIGENTLSTHNIMFLYDFTKV
jgi:hypothetical protein